MHPNASFSHLSSNILGVVQDSVCDRDDAALHRGKPQGESPCTVLYENAKEALNGPEDCSVDHDRLLLLVAFISVCLQEWKHNTSDMCTAIHQRLLHRVFFVTAQLQQAVTYQKHATKHLNNAAFHCLTDNPKNSDGLKLREREREK